MEDILLRLNMTQSAKWTGKDNEKKFDLNNWIFMLQLFKCINNVSS
jgi:hypothetical protein